jgi:hypothetical protein
MRLLLLLQLIMMFLMKIIIIIMMLMGISQIRTPGKPVIFIVQQIQIAYAKIVPRIRLISAIISFAISEKFGIIIILVIVIVIVIDIVYILTDNRANSASL